MQILFIPAQDNGTPVLVFLTMNGEIFYTSRIWQAEAPWFKLPKVSPTQHEEFINFTIDNLPLEKRLQFLQGANLINKEKVLPSQIKKKKWYRFW